MYDNGHGVTQDYKKAVEWYKKAAEDNDIELEYEEARKIIYGMPYSDWKDKYQKEMTQEQKERFEARKKRN